ncbi:hypothetical protein THRCLA_01552 [Thraustotheca clavata]|uniref:Protein kinase domain-containing protein n=1 Tax=Thraustotheca clavata TaxID=74557 RepID=A0A1W0A800_9STRA|nr:hypothetical protein THRCLA_01552 [Thraustotheca clavata]
MVCFRNECNDNMMIASPLNRAPVLLDRYTLLELLSTKNNPGGIEHWIAEDSVTKRKISLKISTNQKLLALEHAPYKLYKNINIVGTDQEIITVPPPPGMPNLYLFTLDYVDRDLQTILYEAKNGQLPAFQAREITFRLCHALHYLHDEEKVAHCDIRPANVLLSASMDIRLTGLKSLQNRRNAIRHIKPHEVQLMDTRKLMYCAPEYFGEWTFPANNAAETTTFESADIWSLGILLYEMLYGLHPFLDAIFELNATDKIKYGELLALYREQNGPPIEFPTSPNTVPEFAKNFIRQCLAPNAFERPRALRLLEGFV